MSDDDLFSIDYIEPGLPLDSDGCVITAQEPVYVIPGGSLSTLKFIARTKGGAAADLSQWFPVHSDSDSDSDGDSTTTYLEARVQEEVRASRGLSDVVGLHMSVIDAAQGEFSIPIRADATIPPGVYRMEVAFFLDEELRKTWRCMLLVEGSLYLDEQTRRLYPGPPPLSEIRARIADRSAEDNKILADVDFELGDLVSAFAGPIKYFHEQPPLFPAHYNRDTRNFPYREMWLQGIVGSMYKSAALRRMRNDSAIEMQGISLNEDKFWQQYMAYGDQQWNDFRSHVNVAKTAMSQRRGMSIHSSPWEIFGNF